MEAAHLRRRAEAQLRMCPAATGAARTEADTQRLVHELQVHQIELEMQNEELQCARREMEAALEKYSDLYEFAPVGYLTLDRGGAICGANLTCATLLGIERSRLLKLPFGLCLSPADRPALTNFLAKVFTSHAKESCEGTVLNTERLPMDVRIEAVVAENGHECRAVLTDITEHKQAEADRLILNKLESTGVLAAGIAHDFNNLLTVVLLDIELAEALIPPGDELGALLEEAKKAVVAAGSLTRQFIAFAKGGMPDRKTTFLPDLIRKSSQALNGSNVRCEYFLADNLYLAELDEMQIGQVFQNLFQNAKEAMPEGGVISVKADNVVLAVRGKPSLPPGDYVRVTVEDHGDGITKDILPKIFDPYFSTKERGSQRGMGLGLTICHTVIRDHGGAIAVTSTVGEGTCFQIDLPASRKLLAETKTPASAGIPRHGKVLVMDDEERLRKVMGLTLWGLGQEVEVAADGEMAVELYKKAKALNRPFDIVILDLTVRGGMGGLDTVQALLKIDPTVQAVVMSGYADHPVIQEFERHGFKGVVAKPFGRINLQEVLIRIMGCQPEPKVTP